MALFPQVINSIKPISNHSRTQPAGMLNV